MKVDTEVLQNFSLSMVIEHVLFPLCSLYITPLSVISFCVLSSINEIESLIRINLLTEPKAVDPSLTFATQASKLLQRRLGSLFILVTSCFILSDDSLCRKKSCNLITRTTTTIILDYWYSYVIQTIIKSNTYWYEALSAYIPTCNSTSNAIPYSTARLTPGVSAISKNELMIVL